MLITYEKNVSGAFIQMDKAREDATKEDTN